MRNLLRSIPFLLLMMSGLSLVLNCKGTASNPTPTLYTVTFDAQGGSTVDSVKVEQGKTITKPTDPVKASFTFGGWYKERECTTPWNFDSDTVTANITLYAKWTPVLPETVTVAFTVKGGNGTLTVKAGDAELTSGAQVKKDTDVTFTVNPNSGYELDYLLINDKPKTDMTVTVKADKNLTAIVKFKAKGAPATALFTVDYKAEPAEGGSINAKYSDGTDFSSGGKIEKGTVLVFTAKPNTGYDISTWTGATAESDNKTAKLTVTANSSVTVTFIKQHAVEQHTVSFDAQGGSTVASVKVEHGKTVTKPTDPKKTSFTFGGWYKERECTTLWNFATDTVTTDITLYAKWQTTSTTSITIRFDSTKMDCRKNGHSINDGATVYKDDRLFFEAENLPTGQTVDKWKVNGKDQDYQPGPSPMTWFKYTVRAEDVQSDGSITIDYTPKTAAHATIRFDPSKIACWKGPSNSINNGTTVYENDIVEFEAIGIPTGQMVDKWKLNGKEDQDFVGDPWFGHVVRAEDVQSDGSITIDYTVKPAAQVTIRFDPSKMTCKKNDETPVIADSMVYENDRLVFNAINLPSGKTVDKWKVNGVEREDTDATKRSFTYPVQAVDIQSDGSITIDYTVN